MPAKYVTKKECVAYSISSQEISSFFEKERQATDETIAPPHTVPPRYDWFRNLGEYLARPFPSRRLCAAHDHFVFYKCASAPVGVSLAAWAKF